MIIREFILRVTKHRIRFYMIVESPILDDWIAIFKVLYNIFVKTVFIVVSHEAIFCWENAHNNSKTPISLVKCSKFNWCCNSRVLVLIRCFSLPVDVLACGFGTSDGSTPHRGNPVFDGWLAFNNGFVGRCPTIV